MLMVKWYWIRHVDNNLDDCPYEKKYIKETFNLLEKNGYFKSVNL